ncbi:MAG: trimethylamine methyltransferase family protein [bacterium]|nr:trimethylamine methyltransferase family protein [bacterium]
MTAPRRRGRTVRRSDRSIEHILQPTFELPQYTIATEEQADKIHEVSLRILSEAGIAFYDDVALATLRAAGATVDDEQVVRFDPDMVEAALAQAPAEFTHSARDSSKAVVYGGNNMVLAPVAGPPYVMDAEGGRREGQYADLVNFIKMANATPYLQQQGTEICATADIPFHERVLDINYAHIRWGTKPMMGHYPIGMCAADSVSMAKIVHGADRVAAEHFLMAVINVSSPRRLDDRMLGVIREYATENQALVLTPFILAGAMGPAAILGTVAQANAEVLGALVYAQLINPGTPCIYGPFLATLDLQSGSPVFGSAESLLAQTLCAQMARRYDMPFRAAGTYASSKVTDMQAGYEAVMAMLPSMINRPNFILHAAGWLENGLTTSYEKFAMDLELCGVLLTLAGGVSWNDEEWALDAILDEVPPGGHHLGTEHTMNRFRTAFHRTPLFDHDSFAQWEAAGSRDSTVRATESWKHLIDRYVDPGLDDTIDAELQDFMARRRTEIDPAEFQ